MTTRIEYAEVRFHAPGIAIPGSSSLQSQVRTNAVNGMRLVRVIGDGCDDLTFPGAAQGDGYEVPWRSVASAKRMLVVEALKPEAEPETEPEPQARKPRRVSR